MINLLIRVDGGNYIGTGHIYRCLNLASYIKNANIEFVCKNMNKNLQSLILKNYKLNIIEKNNGDIISMDKKTWLCDTQINDANKTLKFIKNKNIDWVIIDHYSIDKDWEDLIKPFVKKIFVIEDYVNRKHNCDVLLNQLIYDKLLYKDLVNETCNFILGKEYIILDKKYLNNYKYNPGKILKRISIFMGGSDKTNETLKIINLCNFLNKKFDYPFIFDVILGPNNNNIDNIQKLCNSLDKFILYYNINNIEEIYLKSDLCIGSAGISVFEKCILRIPSILICVDINQKNALKEFIDANITNYIGTISNNYLLELESRLIYYYKNPQQLYLMYNNCKDFFNRKTLSNFEKNINKIFNIMEETHISYDNKIQKYKNTKT